MPRKSAQKSPAQLEAEILKLKARIKEVEAEAQTGDELDPDELALPGETKVAELVALLGDTGSLDIYRLEGGRRSQMGTFDVTSQDEWRAAMESILKIKGGGDYLCIFRNGAGQQIGQLKRSYDPQIFKPEVQGKESPAADQSAGLFAKFLEMQAAKDAIHQRELAAMQAEMRAASQENMRLILDMVKATQSTPLKTIQDLAAAKNLFVERDDPIERMLDLRDLMGELRGEARKEEESPLMRILENFAEGIAKAGPRRTHTPPKPPDPKPAPVSPAPQASRQSPDPARGSIGAPAPEAVERPSLLRYVESFKSAIEAEVTSVEAARAVYAKNDTPEKLAILRREIEHGDWEGLLADPVLAAHKLWLTGFRELLHELATRPEASPS